MDPRISRRDWLRGTALAALGLGLGPRLRLGAQELDRPPPEGRHINLAGNENPFGPAPAVVQAILRAAPQSSRYPFREEYVLKELLAQKEGVTIDHIVLGNGCDELLALAAAAFLGPGSSLIAADPTYFQITDYADKLGAEIRRIEHRLDTLQHDLPAMAAAVDGTTRLVYVCNPDNPSGTILPPDVVAAFCREVAPRAPVFVDEVYLDLQDDPVAQTQVALVKQRLPVIVGRSFSKLHGLAGHRIGYVVTTPELATALSHRQMSSVNYLGVAAARASLFETTFHAWSLRKIREGRARFCTLLDELDLRYVPSHGNFVFHRTGIPMADFQATMKERGFLVGWPHAPAARYPDWCRVSIGTDDEMKQYAVAMRDVFRRPAA
ncbi:MAG TPA: histidinol-phosphate transaminase [Opitutaceae bacterium]